MSYLVFQGKKHILVVSDFDVKDVGKYAAFSKKKDAYTKGIVDLAIAPTLFIANDNVIAKTSSCLTIPVEMKGTPRPNLAIYKVGMKKER